MDPSKPAAYAYAPTKSGGKLRHSLGQAPPEESVLCPSDESSQEELSSCSSMEHLYNVPDMEDSDEDVYAAGELFQRVRASTPVADALGATEPAAAANEPPVEAVGLAGCKCGNCIAMPLAIEQKCCSKETLNATHLQGFIPNTGMCVLASPTIQHILSDLSIQCAWLMQRKYQGFQNEALNFVNMSNREYRYHAYRSYTLYMNAILGKYNRKVVPACIVGHIRSRWPSEDNNYVGFIDVDEDGNPIHNDELAEL